MTTASVPGSSLRLASTSIAAGLALTCAFVAAVGIGLWRTGQLARSAATDASQAGTSPLSMKGVLLFPESPTGSDLRVTAVAGRLAPLQLGPFALNVARAPELHSIELRFTTGAGRETIVSAERARWERGSLTLDGRVVARGADGCELRTNRLVWSEGSERLNVPGVYSRRGAGGFVGPGIGATVDLRLQEARE